MRFLAGEGETGIPDISKCRQCEQMIIWHVSKGGKKYPCDSDDSPGLSLVCWKAAAITTEAANPYASISASSKPYVTAARNYRR
jgi:hypothetical protein